MSVENTVEIVKSVWQDVAPFLGKQLWIHKH